MPEKWTNRSRPPASGVMKPNPLSSENHLTVPVPTDVPRSCHVRPATPTLSCRTYPGRATRRKGRLSGQLAGGGGDLVAVAGTGHPRQPQRVVRVARDHVHMEVEDR